MDRSSLATPTMMRFVGAMGIALATLCASAASLGQSHSGDEMSKAIDIPNARMPFEGVLTGGQPTPEQLEEMKQAGYQIIVNLRPAAEIGDDWDEAKAVGSLGMTYVSIPVAGGAGLTDEAVERLHEIVDEPGNRPLVVHCASGNRVGALFALVAARKQGKSVQEAIEIGRQAGLTGLEDEVRERLR